MTTTKLNPKKIQTKKRPSLQATPVALASLLCLASHVPSALAQAALELQGAAPEVTTVVVTQSRLTRADHLTGFSGAALRDLPQSVVVITGKDIADKGLSRLSDLTKLDPSTSESYNAVGYWDFLEVRGFQLNNRYNYRREGLPISAETSIPLDNKASIEILKGTSGMQAGTSSPGGLVNYSVKRPTQNDLLQVTTALTTRGGVLLGLDTGGRMGQDKLVGYRFNALQETLRPSLAAANGQRELISLAIDRRLGSNALIEAEIEISKRSQPSQAAFSVWGNALPASVDPRINLNNQTWSQPVVMGATTATVKLTQSFNDNWSLLAQLGSQQLRTDDRIAYPSGCAGSYGPSFCADGSFDVYDFRSEGEKRQLNSGKLSLTGRVQAAGLTHMITVEHLRSHTQERFNLYAYNYAGTSNIAGAGVAVADPSLSTAGVNRDERRGEWMLSNQVALGKWRGFGGVRLTQLERASVGVDASAPTRYAQNLSTPWLGLSYALGSSMLYLSSGQGVESYVTPNKPSYIHAGQALPAQKSQQFEIGMRGGHATTSWSVAWFDITRPSIGDDGTHYLVDGAAKHKGIEAQIHQTLGPLQLGASTMLLNAVRSGSTDSSINGKKPTNVPENTLRLQSQYKMPGTPWRIQNVWVRDGARAVTPTNDVMLPAWWRWDMALTYQQTIGPKSIQYRLGIDNLTDRRYWKGSPTQFGNYFLYPGAPKTYRFVAQIDF